MPYKLPFFFGFMAADPNFSGALVITDSDAA